MSKFIASTLVDLIKINKNLLFARVRDWKGYGIVQQCGTCEPCRRFPFESISKTTRKRLEEEANQKE